MKNPQRPAEQHTDHQRHAKNHERMQSDRHDEREYRPADHNAVGGDNVRVRSLKTIVGRQSSELGASFGLGLFAAG